MSQHLDERRVPSPEVPHQAAGGTADTVDLGQDQSDELDSIASEFAERWRCGESPSIEDYERRYPQYAEQIRELFPTIVAIERSKAQRASGSGGPAGMGSRKIERLGDFRIVREIGRGGMGIVYEAEQESLARHVAVKVLPPQALMDDQQIRRFQREAQMAAGLHHTNIVPVFGVGEQDGLHYYVMQLIDGDGLDHLLKRSGPAPLEIATVVHIGQQVAEALQYAHEQGTLHRDIKPANLLLDRHGHVWITDFGLAQVLDADGTVTNLFGGTPRYMAPERFQGEADSRSDVYSLGITLYELATGRVAFDATNKSELLRQVTQTEPARPRTINPQIPADLETIILTAIQREPSRRYATAGTLADDLRRFAEGRPIEARRITPVGRFWRWCRRNRALAASLATAALLLVAITAVMTLGYWRAAKLNTELEASLGRERATSELALDALRSVFDQFAPSQIPMASLVTGGESDQSETVAIPVQPVPSPQVAAALQSLLPFYHRLAERREQDTNVRLQAADAYHRIGLIQTQLGEFDAALAAYEQAVSMLEQLSSALSERREDLSLAIARIQNDTGDLERLRSRYRESDEAYRSSLRRLEQIGNASASREYRFELARSHISLAQRHRLPPGPRHLSPRIRIHPKRDLPGGTERRAQRLPFNRPPGPLGFPDGSDVRPLRPPLELPAEDMDRRAHLEAAISLLEELVEEHPDDPKFRLLLAKSYRERAAGPIQQKTADRAKALELIESLVEEFPSIPDYRFELSQTYAEIGFPALFAGQPGSESQLREALSISEDLVSRFPHNLAYTVAQVQIRVRLGIMLYHKDQTPEAIALLREALASQTALSDRFSGEGVYLIQLAMLTHLLSDLLLEAGQTGEALQVLEGAATRLTELDSHSPRPAFVAGALAGTFERWGELLHQQGEDERADEAILRARQYWKELDAANVGRR